jgi:putative Holliday junction resolvase
MRVMCLDVGDRRIGVAMSDPTGLIASPREVVYRSDDESAYNAIARLAGQYQAEEMVIGMPYSLSGAIGPAAEKVKAFAEELARRVTIKIITWDERMTTIAADRAMRETGVKKQRQNSLRDAIAAALILQSYLDSRRAGSQ